MKGTNNNPKIVDLDANAKIEDGKAQPHVYDTVRKFYMWRGNQVSAIHYRLGSNEKVQNNPTFTRYLQA